jgi:hypothetical protein
MCLVTLSLYQFINIEATFLDVLDKKRSYKSCKPYNWALDEITDIHAIHKTYTCEFLLRVHGVLMTLVSCHSLSRRLLFS